MKRMNESELENVFRNEIRKMPGWKAPEDLRLRVMLAIQAKARLPWWKQSIWAWPLAMQIAAFTLLGGVGALVAYLGWFVPGTISNTAVWNELVSCVGRMGQVWNAILIMANALDLAMKTGLQFWLLIIFSISCFLCLFCLGAGSLVMHLAWKRSR
jgi:hypothetical protein